jgi:hypothetical protein
MAWTGGSCARLTSTLETACAVDVARCTQVWMVNRPVHGPEIQVIPFPGRQRPGNRPVHGAAAGQVRAEHHYLAAAAVQLPQQADLDQFAVAVRGPGYGVGLPLAGLVVRAVIRHIGAHLDRLPPDQPGQEKQSQTRHPCFFDFHYLPLKKSPKT